MSNLFYFVRDRLSVADVERIAEEHGLTFVKQGSRPTLMLINDKGMPRAIAYLLDEDGLFYAYMSDKKSYDFPLIEFFQVELKMPVVTDKSKFVEKVILYNRLKSEISKGRDDKLTSLALIDPEAFVYDFKGTVLKVLPNRSIAKNKEREDAL